jgi:hypothetical protein
LEELAAALRASRTAVPVPPPFDPDVTLIGNREGNQREVRIYQQDARRQKDAVEIVSPSDELVTIIAERLAEFQTRPVDGTLTQAYFIATSIRNRTRPGPDEVTVSREALANLVAHVKHDVLCTPTGPETYMGLECCRHGQCAEAEAEDEIHGSWVGSFKLHPAITPEIRAALSPTPDTKETGQ